MRKIINNLRRQPEHVRRHFLHVFTIVAGVILVLFWIYSLGTNIKNEDTRAKIENDLKPFSALKDNLLGGYINLTDSE